MPKLSCLPWLCAIQFGCLAVDTPITDAGIQDCPKVDASIPDMATPLPKCAAAEGLKGDNLLCVDFKEVQNLSTLGGWDFSTSCPTLWTTTGGKLQVNNFSTFMSSCTFSLPPLSAADYQKYSRFTLAILHRVSLDESVAQKAQVMQGADDPLNRLMTQWTGKQARQQSTLTISKSDLPGGAASYQPLFKLSSTNTASGIYQGWQIESIAINGIP